MAKVSIYKTDKKDILSKETKRVYQSKPISEILNKEGLSHSKCTIFLNNKKTSDYNYTLKREDMLFIFNENN